ncbi:MAG: hypothetical protein R3C56_22940 [Pirellulaceae bacterium]
MEQEGTYPLPEAQLDRFRSNWLSATARVKTSIRSSIAHGGTVIATNKIMDGEEIRRWQQLVREVILAKHVQDYIVRLVLATHPEGQMAQPITNQYIRWGSSPRGAQTMALAAKVRALLDGPLQCEFRGCPPFACPLCDIASF